MPVIRFTTQMAREYIGPMGIYWTTENILEIHWDSRGLRFGVKSIKLINLMQLRIIIIAIWHSDVVVFTHGEEMFQLLHKLNLYS